MAAGTHFFPGKQIPGKQSTSLEAQTMRTPATTFILTAAVAVALAAFASPALGIDASGDWNHNGSGNWSDTTKWITTPAGNYPTGVGQDANLTYDLSSDATISLDVDVTLGTLDFGDPTNGKRFTLNTDSNSLIFDNGAGTAEINLIGKKNYLQAPMLMNSSLTITSNATGDHQYVQGDIDGNSTGAVTLTLDNTGSKGLYIESDISNGTAGGTVALDLNSPSDKLIFLQGDNSHTGGTTMTAGKVRLLSSTCLGATASTFTFNGGTLDGKDGGDPDGKLTIANNNPVAINANMEFKDVQVNTFGSLDFGTGAVSLGDEADEEITINTNKPLFTSLTFGGNISDGNSNNSLNKTGGGKLILKGTNTYTGTTTIGNGVLQFNSPASLYDSNTAKWTRDNIIVESGGALGVDLDGFGAANLTTLLDSSHLGSSDDDAGLMNGSSISLDASSGSATYSQNIIDVTNVSGGTNAIGVTKVGASTVVLTGTNTYTGDTVINDGSLRVGTNAAALPASSCLRFYTTTDAGTLRGFGVLEANGTFSRDIGTGAGEVYFQGSGGWAAVGGDLTVTLDSNATIDWNSASGFNQGYLLMGSENADGRVLLTNDIELNNKDNRESRNRTVLVTDNPGSANDYAELSGTISNDLQPGKTSGISVSGNGDNPTLVLSGDNTFIGMASAKAGCTLVATEPNSFGVGTTNGYTINGTLGFRNDANTDFGMTIEVGGNFTPYLVVGPSMGGSATDGTHTIAVLRRNSNGNGAVEIISVNGYGLNIGTFYPERSGITFTNNADGRVTIGTIAAGGTANSNTEMTGTGTTVVTGAVAGVCSSKLIVSGSSTVILNGACTYTGSTEIQDTATLIVGGSIASNVTFSGANGATLGGGGTINGTVSVTGNNTLAPGNSVGTLSVTGHCSVSGSSSYEWEFDGAGDSVTVGGDLTLDNGWELVLDQLDGAIPVADTEYALFTVAGDIIYDGSVVVGDVVFDPAHYDVNSDGVEDATEWNLDDIEVGVKFATGVVYLTGLGGAGSTPGDTNSDGVVDAADYMALKLNLGSGPGAGQEDGDVCDGAGAPGQDGYVNLLDLDLMAEALNPSAGGQTIPEPGSAFLFLGGAGWLLRRRKAKA